VKVAASTGRYGRAKFRVAAGKDGVVKISVTSKLRAALKTKHRVIVMATASIATQGGGKLTVDRKLTIVAPKAHRRS
jgi:hypothetical protein